ncbi:hypothetical protein [Paenibacillus aquistagni]|uniref:hypothetical protein n=1 Tax=Paenibacillus aquistagni TaxID=1852522 RepID=UPI00145BF65B|nr:hypothetical protein [Paenibacillus aquistagni]NMM55570.1 hypothetical protein [Paenibacillus aquistagni]
MKASKFLCKKFVATILTLALLFVLVPFNEVRAESLEATSQLQTENNVVTFFDPEFGSNGIRTIEPGVTPLGGVIDNKAMDIDISVYNGKILGQWKYKSSIGLVTFVNLKMTLQYRENFLHSWADIDEAEFVYHGGLGFIEENEAEFQPSMGSGSYRIVMSGQVSGEFGYSLVLDRASSTLKIN